MKEANLKKLHTLWWWLNDILDKAKLWRQLIDQWLPGVAGEGEMNGIFPQRILRAVNPFHLILQCWVNVVLHSSQNVQQQEWIFMSTMDFGWWWHASVGLSTVTNVGRSEGDKACMGISILSIRFFCEPKTALKNQVYLIIIIISLF